MVNLYPFAETLTQLSRTKAIPYHGRAEITRLTEKIDIGGPTLIRAAAKNSDRVTVLVDHQDYAEVIGQLKKHAGISENFRLAMAAKAFRHTADYESIIAGYFTGVTQHAAATDSNIISSDSLPETFNTVLVKQYDLRYGENPHQQAAFYVTQSSGGGKVTDGMASAEQVQGKPLSFNNIADADAALRCVSLFTRAACVIVKHTNPCGIAEADNITQAYSLAYQTDPVSAYGGIIAFNCQLDAEVVTAILAKQFVEVIIAPAVSQEARALLQKRPGIRLLIVALRPQKKTAGVADFNLIGYDIKKVSGGMLVQQQDYNAEYDHKAWKVVTRRKPDKQAFCDFIFAWNAVQCVKSNAIVYAQGGQLLGIGAGQTSRVMSAEIAVLQAERQQLSLTGAVMASDAFLPFRDGVDVAAAAGITGVIQPGGSKRDQEVIDAADEANMAMVFTGKRHFRH